MNPQIGAQHTPENQATRLRRCESKIPRSRIEFSVWACVFVRGFRLSVYGGVWQSLFSCWLFYCCVYPFSLPKRLKKRLVNCLKDHNGLNHWISFSHGQHSRYSSLGSVREIVSPKAASNVGKNTPLAQSYCPDWWTVGCAGWKYINRFARTSDIKHEVGFSTFALTKQSCYRRTLGRMWSGECGAVSGGRIENMAAKYESLHTLWQLSKRSYRPSNHVLVLCHVLAAPYSHTLANHSGSIIDLSESHPHQHWTRVALNFFQTFPLSRIITLLFTIIHHSSHWNFFIGL